MVSAAAGRTLSGHHDAAVVGCARNDRNGTPRRRLLSRECSDGCGTHEPETADRQTDKLEHERNLSKREALTNQSAQTDFGKVCRMLRRAAEAWVSIQPDAMVGQTRRGKMCCRRASQDMERASKRHSRIKKNQSEREVEGKDEQRKQVRTDLDLKLNNNT